ncbi:MAG: hypothetical protein A2041_00630 [Bacteroidetes bacterium GWA2_31_9b]|nr:MAG: hypothetical protein A2041_00630 [Bacteroidetes bacterium GWA2_31_9b]
MPNSIETLIKETKSRARYFQAVHAWPLNEKLDYDGWLSNFKSDEEIKIACSILDFFIYYPDNMVDQMLKSSIDHAGYYLSNTLSDWKHEDFVNRCFYSFIPGENQNPSDSGRLFLRKLRDVLGIPENRLIEYAQIPEVLDKIGKPTPIILVDDFVGSGAQCDKAWNRNKFNHNDKTLKQISETEGHVFVYSPLIVNYQGYERIKNNCKDLILTQSHILGKEYNLFNKECFCWKNDDTFFHEGTSFIIQKSAELGIPDRNGNHPQDVRGFGQQGLAIAFEHGAPDAIPSFFYWCHKDWIPLIQKTYHR